MAIAEHGCCFYLTVVGVIILLDNLPTTKVTRFPGNLLSLSWSSIVPPWPLAAKYLQNINDPLQNLTIDMRCFSSYEFHFATKHIDGVYGHIFSTLFS